MEEIYAAALFKLRLLFQSAAHSVHHNSYLRDIPHKVIEYLDPACSVYFVLASRVSQSRALMPEEIFADDEKLTKLSDQLEAMSAAKKYRPATLCLTI